VSISCAIDFITLPRRRTSTYTEGEDGKSSLNKFYLQTILGVCFALVLTSVAHSQASRESGRSLRMENWVLQTSATVTDSGETLSMPGAQIKNWLPAVVPGTVVGSLAKDNVIPDPYYGINLRNLLGDKFNSDKVQDDLPMDSDNQFFVPWWYRTEFTVPANLKGKVLWLHFGGINYRADIWFNGRQLTDAKATVGTWRIYDFNITELVRYGSANALAVRIYPSAQSDDLAISYVDWNPATPDRYMGLFREVSIVSAGPVAIRYPAVISRLDLPDTSRAHLTVAVRLVNGTKQPQRGTLHGTIENIQFSQAFDLKPEETRDVLLDPGTFPQLNLENPRLWWPAQMGTPNLYSLKLNFVVNEEQSYITQTRFGIRKITSELDANGHLLIRVNGKKILIRGGGWSMDLMNPKSSQQLHQEFDYVKDLGLNSIRLEGMLETDEFFDLADEQGILIMAGWTCSLWETWVKWGNEQFQVAEESLRSQILRLRSHPSMFVWANGSDFPPPPDLEKKYLAIEREYHWPDPIISSVTQEPTPVTGASGVKETGPYDYVIPEFFMDETAEDESDRGGATGFNTETGPGPSIPPIETLQEILPKEHLWPIDDWWTFHAGLHDYKDLHVFTNSLNLRYGEPSTLDDFLVKSQMMRYEAVRAMFEAYTRNKYTKATGVILWMLNNCWPSLIWNLYDYHLRTAGGYYGAKIALESLHPLYGYDDRSISLTNSRYENANGLTVIAHIYDLDMKERYSHQQSVDAPADSSNKIFTLPELKDLTPVYFLKLSVKDHSGRVVGSNFYWLSTTPETITHYPNVDGALAETFADFRALRQLPKVKLETTSETSQQKDRQLTRVRLRNDSASLAFFVKVNLTSCSNGKDIVPVLWNDNYVSLLPGETRELTASFRAMQSSPVRVDITGWNVSPLSIGCSEKSR
jgi:exo-1,4-beta-D-glucosaminidase